MTILSPQAFHDPSVTTRCGREIEHDDDRIMINDCILDDLQREVEALEMLQRESVKDVEVASQRLQGIRHQLEPMSDYLDKDAWARSIDPNNPQNKLMTTWTDEKRQEMYDLAVNVNSQLLGIHDKVYHA